MNFKSLYAFRNSLFSTLIIVVGMLVFNSESSYSACPPGYTGPFTITLYYTPGCRMDVEYCLKTGITVFGSCDIYIGNFTFFDGGLPPNNCISNYQRDIHARIIIPWDFVISSIIQANIIPGCFPTVLNLPDCAGGTTRPIIKVSTGGCYHYVYGQFEGIPYERYEACDISGQSYCRQEYTLCKEWVNGQWKLKTAESQSMPQYNCVGGTDCFRVCASTNN